jgi:hypothetical protein
MFGVAIDLSLIQFASLRGALATKQSSLSLQLLDCFAEPVIGPAKPDPLARNDERYAAALRLRRFSA